MKRYFFTLALAAALMSSCGKSVQDEVAGTAADSASFAIAYVNTDLLLREYGYAQKMNEMLNGKAETARADFNQKARVFQQDVAEFQRKVKNNAFLSMERAQSEQNRLQKTEQELQELNQKLSADLMQEQSRLTMELQDTVTNFLKEYAKDKFTLILSDNMGDNVLYAAPGVDITKAVIAELNARYNRIVADVKE